MRRNAPKAHPEQVPADGKSRKRRAAGNRLRRKTAPGKGHRNRGLGKVKGMKARVKAGAPPHGRERGNLSVEGQMRGRNASLRVGKGVRREAYRIGLWERPAAGKGGIHSIAVHVDRKDAPRVGKGSPGREGPGAAPRPQALAGPLQTRMRGCRMRDAGDQPKTFMSSAPTLPATVAIAASAEIPPARLFSACSRELMRISCMASRLP
jgi:hypothetical protein